MILSQDGNKMEEFVSLLTSHQGRINSYILTLVPHYSDAADIMQETSKMMFSRFSEFEIGTDFLAWGLSIAHYRILEYRSKKKKERKEVLLSDRVIKSLHEESAKRQDVSKEYQSLLKKCYGLLEEGDQRVILLRYHENLKVKDISARLGKTVQSIYRNIARIQESLRRCIKRSYNHGGAAS